MRLPARLRRDRRVHDDIMLRFYLNNDSYPELREINMHWARSLTWMRAILHAAGHLDFWIFAGVQTLLAALIGPLTFTLTRAAGTIPAIAVTLFATLTLFGYLQVSWGGDMMRRHLRAVSETARYACPNCGHNLFGHLDGETPALRCPECAERVERALFEPPFKLPERYRAFPPWRRRT